MSDAANRMKFQPNAIKKWVFTPWPVIFGVPLLVLLFDPGNAKAITVFAIRAFAGTAPFIAVAVLLIAYLKAAGAEALIANVFKGKEIRMIFAAALFGGLAPFCSCEVIPFIAGLLSLGAPLSAVMAFWLSSPLIDPPTLFITAGALGWFFAVSKAVFAVTLGLFGGFTVKLLLASGRLANPLRPRTKPDCACPPPLTNNQTKWQFWTEQARRDIFRSEFLTNALFLIKWLAFAYVLEALLVFYVPASLIARFAGGGGIVSIVSAALIGMPAYLNGYIAPPLLAGLIDQGMGNGAAMAFIIAGSVSSIPAMTAVWSLVKPGVFFVYIGLGLIGAILSGIIFQAVSISLF